MGLKSEYLCWVLQEKSRLSLNPCCLGSTSLCNIQAGYNGTKFDLDPDLTFDLTLQMFKPQMGANELHKGTPPVAIAVKHNSVYVARSDGIAKVDVHTARATYLRRNTSQVSALKIYNKDRSEIGKLEAV